jgi:hypothetical protein
MDVNAENNSLDEAEVKVLEQNEELKSLLTSVKSTYKTIKLGTKDIRIKAYMPKKVRLDIIKATKELGNVEDAEDVDKTERKFYPLVAAMCIDAPYSDEKTWQFIDERESCIQDVTMKIIAEVNTTDVKIKSFR